MSNHDHAGDEHHGHSHGVDQFSGLEQSKKRLMITLVITFSVFLIQIVGAFLSGSMALLGDSIHMLTDSLGIVIALIAAGISARPAVSGMTYGWRRVEILAALINGVIVLLAGVMVLVEGIRRLGQEPEVQEDIMLFTAIIGLVANVTSLMILSRVQKQSLNAKGAYLEVLGDALGSFAVIIAALIIQFTGFVQADALASILIGLLILPRAFSLLREVALVLLEASPKNVDLSDLRQHMSEVEGVKQVHDLHVWTITSGLSALTSHVVLDQSATSPDSQAAVLKELNTCIDQHFDVKHSTIQFEFDAECGHEGLTRH